jgi:hypothetical protein
VRPSPAQKHSVAQNAKKTLREIDRELLHPKTGAFLDTGFAWLMVLFVSRLR